MYKDRNPLKNFPYTKHFAKLPFVLLIVSWGLGIPRLVESFKNGSPLYLLILLLLMGTLSLSVLYYKKVYFVILDLEFNMDLLLNHSGRTNKLSGQSYLTSLINDVLVRNIQEAKDNEYKALLLKKQAEVTALQSQINPHFLYNTLESIRGRAMETDENSGIANMTEALAVFFRYSISNTSNIVTLDDEIRNVENYLSILKFRFEDRFHFEKIFEQSLDPSLFYVPKLILQPLVENSINHGLEEITSKGFLKLRVEVTDKHLYLTLSDNGRGIDSESLANIRELINKEMSPQTYFQASNKKGIGMALKNVNDRIRLYFGSMYGISLYSTMGMGTSVELMLPKVTDENLRDYNI